MDELPFNDDLEDIFEEDYDELIQEFKDNAFLALLENPGSDCSDWITNCIDEYPAETVDAFGTNPHDVYETLTDWWDTMDYEDPTTGISKTYRDWAKTFANEEAADIYRELEDMTHERDNLKEIVARLRAALDSAL